jgi:hypothetical protein
MLFSCPIKVKIYHPSAQEKTSDPCLEIASLSLLGPWLLLHSSMPIITQETIIDCYSYRGFKIQIFSCLYSDNLPRYWAKIQRPKPDIYAYTAGVWEINPQIVYRKAIIRVDWLIDMVDAGKADTCQPEDLGLLEEWLYALGDRNFWQD